MDETSAPSAELLEPVNLHLNIKRNLAAAWYKKMVPVEVTGDLKPMKVGEGPPAHQGSLLGSLEDDVDDVELPRVS